MESLAVLRLGDDGQRLAMWKVHHPRFPFFWRYSAFGLRTKFYGGTVSFVDPKICSRSLQRRCKGRSSPYARS